MDEVEKVLQDRFLLQTEYLGETKPINNVIPLVSVTVTTYQHANYIRECLEGILMQQTNFSYEIIIGEDGSVDGTQEICKEYAERNPNKIRLFIRDRRLSQYIDSTGKVTRFNGIWNRMSSRGKYIAWCEGDDFWNDPLKLQKQVDYLESHPECGLIYSRVLCYSQKERQYVGDFGGPFCSFDDLLLRGNVIPTLTTVFRRSLYNQFSDKLKDAKKQWGMGDYPLWLWLAHCSSVYFMNEVTGVYRVLEESASHTSDLQKRISFINSYGDIRLFFIDYFNISTKTLVHIIQRQRILSLYRAIIECKGDMELVRKKLSTIDAFDLKLFAIKMAVSDKVIMYPFRKLFAFLIIKWFKRG